MYFKAKGPMLKRLQITEEMTLLPEETHHIWVDFARNDEERDLDERTIIRLLRNFSNKVKIVQVKNIGDELSPESVELLEVIITRAEKLVISQWSDLAYSCLSSCLSQPNGLKELIFSYSEVPLSINQARLLFEGVASSSCLNHLCIKTTFEPDRTRDFMYESICNAFLNALQRNRSLKSLDFDVGSLFFPDDSDTFSRIFKAAILDTKIETLYISCEVFGEPFNFPRNLLIEALCNNECKLKELALWNCALVGVSNDDVDQMSNDACNKSLETLHITAENFDLQVVVEAARRFRSLVSLDMENCDVGPHLSLLYPLLIGDEQLLSLQRLKLFGNGIDEDQAIAFFRKLPQMTCIREVCLRSNPFESSEAWMPVLVDTIQRNKSVEYLDLDCQFVPMPSDELGKACSKIDAATRRNQERRLADEYLALVRSKVLPETLWPLVLERAQKPITLSLFKTYNGERVSQHSESELQKDLLNRLLKEKMLQDHLY